MSDLTSTVDTYLSAWNEEDPARRAELVEQAWADDGQLTDPPMGAEGHAAIGALHLALDGQYPGHRFRRASGVDAHHEYLRFAWELVAPDGTVALSGLDVGEVTEDGKLRRIVGFFGDLEPS